MTRARARARAQVIIADCQCVLGRVLARRGDSVGAEAAFRAVVSLEPRSKPRMDCLL